MSTVPPLIPRHPSLTCSLLSSKTSHAIHSCFQTQVRSNKRRRLTPPCFSLISLHASFKNIEYPVVFAFFGFAASLASLAFGFDPVEYCLPLKKASAKPVWRPHRLVKPAAAAGARDDDAPDGEERRRLQAALVFADTPRYPAASWRQIEPLILEISPSLMMIGPSQP